MNYQKLSQEYFEQYQMFSVYIKKLRKALQSNLCENPKILEKRISALYTICLELKHTSQIIKRCERRIKNVH